MKGIGGEKRDVTDIARDEGVGGETRDVTYSVSGKRVVRERRYTYNLRWKWVVREICDVTDSARGMESLGRDVML